MATRRGARGGVTARALALLCGACLAAPLFASDPAGGPILVSDPGTGTTAIIWSRDDGATTKLAWARRDESGWSEAHDLTFGPGFDLSPAVGISRTGTWLFWRGENGQLFVAPVDLSRGHLLAVPRLLARGTGGATTGTDGTAGGGLTGGHSGRGIRPAGGIDIPILVKPCDPANPSLPCVPDDDSGSGFAPGTGNLPPRIRPEGGDGDGGQDIPIIGGAGAGVSTSTATTATRLSVSVVSDPDCDSQFVALIEGRSILMIQFTGSGDVASRIRLRAAAGVDPAAAAAAAGDYFLKAACH